MIRAEKHHFAAPVAGEETAPAFYLILAHSEVMEGNRGPEIIHPFTLIKRALEVASEVKYDEQRRALNEGGDVAEARRQSDRIYQLNEAFGRKCHYLGMTAAALLTPRAYEDLLPILTDQIPIPERSTDYLPSAALRTVAEQLSQPVEATAGSGS